MTHSDWQFDGKLIAVELPRNDRAPHKLVIERQDGRYTQVCVCDKFKCLPEGCGEGAHVGVTLRPSGREWQGRWYAGLTVTSLTVRAPKRRRDDQPEDDLDLVGEPPPSTRQEDDDDVPF